MKKNKPLEAPEEARASESKTLADLLTPLLLGQLARQVFGRECSPLEISSLIAPLPAAPKGLEGLLDSELASRGKGESLVAPSQDFCRASLVGKETLQGYLARPLGLPVYHGLYQSSRWEDGGWDGYNTDVASLAFVVFLRCEPRPGSDRPSPRVAALLGHYHFDGSIKDRKPGSRIRAKSSERLQAAIAMTPGELKKRAAEMNIQGYGARACSGLLDDLPLTDAQLSDLLNPAFCEREALDEALAETPGVKAPRPRV